MAEYIARNETATARGAMVRELGGALEVRDWGRGRDGMVVAAHDFLVVAVTIQE
jgi:hypothetical protein